LSDVVIVVAPEDVRTGINVNADANTNKIAKKMIVFFMFLK
jgi:hypothetical protein